MSVVPCYYSKRPGFRKGSGHRLLAANGTSIQSIGTIALHLHFPGFRPLDGNFIVANVSSPIVGADLLRKWKVVFDFAEGTIKPATTSTPEPPQRTSHHGTVALTVQPGTSPRIQALLNEFHDLFAESLEGLPPVPLQVDDLKVAHHIVTVGPPRSCVPRRFNPEKNRIVEQEIEDMLRQGIIRPSSSPWASPVHLVQKAENKWRLCGDYRRLNVVTQKDNYPLPNIFAFTALLHGARFFSHIDLLKGYWQVPMWPGDIEKTAIATTSGLYEYLRMPFGLRNASNSFQRLMNEMVRGLQGVFVYLDDLLVFSDDLDQHARRLKALFIRLRKFGLKAAKTKCWFGRTQVEFLGFRVDASGVRPPEERVRALLKMPRPTTTMDLRRFLGMLNFYKRFLPGLSGKIQDLYSISNQKGSINWNDNLRSQFEKAKEAIAEATVLAFPKEGAPLCVSSDASGEGLAGVLEQHDQGKWRPLAFFSRKLSPSEKTESTYNRELLGAYSAIRHFHQLIEGKGCALVVDHAPLRGSILGHRDALTDRQRRMLSYIAEMVVNVHSIQGKDNVVADALSRLPVDNVVNQTMVSKGLDLETLEREQLSDPELKFLKPPKYQKVLIDGKNLLCDVTNYPRIYVPGSCRRWLMEWFHNQAHPGVKQSRRIISRQCTWPNMSGMIQEFVKGCRRCQVSKVTVHNRPPLQHFVLPNARFSHVHVDFVGQLPDSHNGNQFLFTCIDRYTRFPIAVPTKHATAEAALEAFFLQWVALFGLPEHLTSDQGPCFRSLQWKGVLQQYNIVNHQSTSYHPEANGMIERWHRSLKSSLIAKGGDWERALPLTLLYLRAAVNEEIKYAPFELVFGTLPMLPGAVYPRDELCVEPHIFASAFNDIRFPAPSIPKWHRKDRDNSHTFDFTNISMAFIRIDSVQPALTAYYSGPYHIIEKGTRAFKLLVDGKEVLVSVDRLKPFVPWRDPHFVNNAIS